MICDPVAHEFAVLEPRSQLNSVTMWAYSGCSVTGRTEGHDDYGARLRNRNEAE